ncbi:hypothetical protein [Hyphobacterium indicum]|uniref:hypothetical protein n=1 Tax=Hyphobacterium indicum TaxID=2162714 RepID=UPI000D64E799|nr:hypothetical protein [Hyphobacterium indicum]
MSITFADDGPLWLELIRLFLAPTTIAAIASSIAAVVGVYVAWRQYKIDQKNYARLLLPDRIEIIDAVQQFIGAVFRDGHGRQADEKPFLDAKDRAQLIFSEDVVADLNEVYRLVLNLNAAEAIVQNPDHTGYDDAVERSYQTSKILIQKAGEVTTKMREEANVAG